MCEEQILQRTGQSTPGDEAAFPARLQQLLGEHVDADALLRYLERVELAPGHRLIRQGEPPGDVYFLAAGRLTAALEQEDGSSVRLRTIARMQDEEPRLVAALHRCFGRLLALRLANTLRTVEALLA